MLKLKNKIFTVEESVIEDIDQFKNQLYEIKKNVSAFKCLILITGALCLGSKLVREPLAGIILLIKKNISLLFHLLFRFFH
jgi:hypothetical protein